MSILYQSCIDNPSFDDLIKEGVVKDEQGTVEVHIPYAIPQSIKDVHYVASGRGLYRVWISNLQKAIRRGFSKEACRSVYECATMEGCFLSNVVNRICKVIVSEDIGCANPILALDCIACIDAYEAKEKPTWNEFSLQLFTIVQKACASYKSRTTMCVGVSYKYIEKKYKTSASVMFPSFEAAFKGLKKGVETRNVYLAIVCLHLCMEVYGREKTTFTRFIPSKFKPQRMVGGKYAVWNYLCDKERFTKLTQKETKKLAVECNIALYRIWYSNMTDEKFINVIQACLQVMLCEEIFNEYIVNDNTVIVYTAEEVASWTDIWPMSAAYDKHTGRYKVNESRNTKQFFYSYGAKVNKLHPVIGPVDQQWYLEKKYKI